jgi:hypothetical protein
MKKDSQIDQQQDDSNYILNAYNYTAKQVRIWNSLSIGAACLGFLLVLIGVILFLIEIYIQGLPVTSITSIIDATIALIGAIPATIAKLFLNTAQGFQKTQVSLLDELIKEEDKKRAIKNIETLKDEIVRENLKLQLLRRDLDLPIVGLIGSTSPSATIPDKPYSLGYGGNEESHKEPHLPVQERTGSASPSEATQMKPHQQRQRRDANSSKVIEPPLQGE